MYSLLCRFNLLSAPLIRVFSDIESSFLSWYNNRLMEIFFIYVNLSYKIVTSILFSEFLLCLQLLKKNQLKLILTAKGACLRVAHSCTPQIYFKMAYFGLLYQFWESFPPLVFHYVQYLVKFLFPYPWYWITLSYLQQES